MDREILFYDPKKEYGWLANFSNHNIQVEAKTFKTVEHYYQSQKFTNGIIKYLIINSPTPQIAKSLARTFRYLRKNNWAYIKNDIMYKAIKYKFTQHQDLRKLLVNTDRSELIEKSDRDYYWGIGKSGLGENIMGKLLMKLREELIKE